MISKMEVSNKAHRNVHHYMIYLFNTNEQVIIYIYLIIMPGIKFYKYFYKSCFSQLYPSYSGIHTPCPCGVFG